ncbi:unnamed protein product [Prunus armeniaca]
MAIRALYFPPCLARFTESLPIKVFKLKAKKESSLKPQTLAGGTVSSIQDYKAAIHFWKVDKFDFVVCMGAFIGVIFGNIEIGLVLVVAISVIRVLLFVARPSSIVYRNVEQYPNASNVPGILILEIDAPIYFANIVKMKTA